MNKPLYSIGTWDEYRQAFTPQKGAGRSINVSVRQLRRVLRRLRDIGYSAHRRGNCKTDHDDNDSMVLVERTDGLGKAEILKLWER